MFAAFRPVLYIKVSPEQLTVRNVKTQESFAERPEVAIGGTPRKVLAIGNAARSSASAPGAEVVNPFGHPRTLVGDFTVGEQLLKAAVRKLQGSSPLAIAPLIVMHPLGSPEGGFTQVERRAFREMALGAGASEVLLWVGRELSDSEVLSDHVLKSESARE
jgi:rod shape-determining protein MreB